MKVVFISPSFYPNIGGVEKHVFEVGEKLIALGHQVEVITEQPQNKKLAKKINYQSLDQSDTEGINTRKPVKSSYSATITHKKIKVFYFDFGNADWFKKFRIWSRLISSWSLFKEADVIHCHDVFIWYFPLRFLFPLKKVFVTFHGYESYPISMKAIIIRKLSEILSNGNICVGKFIEKWYGTRADYIIYGGVEIVREQVVKKSVLSKSSQTSAIFYGRLDEQTGILEYCEAVDKIKSKIPGFKFDIVGDGKYKSKIKEFGKALGFIPNPESKLTNYRFAFLSRYLSILEALAARKMVFALYDNPVKEDYLRMSPFAKFISISKDAETLAKDVIYYINHPDEEIKKVKQGFRWVSVQNWEKIALIYEKLWNK